MSAIQTTNQENGLKTGSFDFQHCRFDNPLSSLSFQKSKWATFRELNVEEIKASFTRNPNSVFIMEDRKLLGTSLVVLRKDVFEKMTKLIQDLCAGQIGIDTELTSINVAAQLALSLAKKNGLAHENPSELPEERDLEKALYLLFQSTSQISKRNFVHYLPIKNEEIVPILSQEERELLENEDD
jgi:hypothetical protein